MIQTQMLMTICAACAGFAALLCAACFALLLKARREARDNSALAARLEADLEELSRDFDTMTKRATEQGRRLAWLEARLRTRAGVEPAPPAQQIESAPAAAAAKPNITERRHRVLSLARRGQDARSIAATLNMPHGEVELMLSLSHAA